MDYYGYPFCRRSLPIVLNRVKFMKLGIFGNHTKQRLPCMRLSELSASTVRTAYFHSAKVPLCVPDVWNSLQQQLFLHGNAWPGERVVRNYLSITTANRSAARFWPCQSLRNRIYDNSPGLTKIAFFLRGNVEALLTLGIGLRSRFGRLFREAAAQIKQRCNTDPRKAAMLRHTPHDETAAPYLERLDPVFFARNHWPLVQRTLQAQSSGSGTVSISLWPRFHGNHCDFDHVTLCIEIKRPIKTSANK